MDAPTWVALSVGLGGLLLTLELDRRNRAERRVMAAEQRRERELREENDRRDAERDRWKSERHSAYRGFLAALEPRIDLAGYRIRNLHHGVAEDGDDPDVARLSAAVTDADSAARELTLVAADEVARLADEVQQCVRSLEWTTAVTQAHAGSRPMPAGERIDTDGVDTEMTQTRAALDALRQAMRRDLGVEV